MKLSASIRLVAAVLLLRVASTTAKYFDYLSGSAVGPRQSDGCARPQFNDAVIGNLSHLFGWQIAGAYSLFPNQLAAACNDISTFGHGQWDAIGLNTADIQRPICTTSNDDLDADPTTPIANIIDFTTQIFITQLLESFPKDNARRYMCKQLDFFLIDYFMLTSADVVGAVCNNVGEQLPPRPFAPARQDPGQQAAATAVKNAASTLYALMLVSGATTDAELNLLCITSPQYTNSLEAIQLNATAFQETICSVKELISVSDAVDNILTGLTEIFIKVLENISDAPGWLPRLCSNSDEGSMNCVGLDGHAVIQELCGGGLPS